MTHQYLVHPRHRSAFATNQIKLRTQPKLLFSSASGKVRWRLMLDQEQIESGLAKNKAQARADGSEAKRRVLENWSMETGAL